MALLEGKLLQAELDAITSKEQIRVVLEANMAAGVDISPVLDEIVARGLDPAELLVD